MQLLYWVLVFLLFIPTTAYAYLDPGTGNILVYIVISLVGALLFSLKSLFYAIIGRSSTRTKKAGSTKCSNSIVIFSEGKNYWNTFKPIVDAMITKKQFFNYYSMDIDDPGLVLENEYINNKYIGQGSMAFAKMGKLVADIVLSTTPNIGTEGYPLPRSSNIKELVHVFHAVDDLAYYHKGSLDNYDTVMLVGEFETEIIRKLEDIRHLKHKALYPAGLPYLDILATKMKTTTLNKTNGKTILVAPSWGTKGCLSIYGHTFIEKLAEDGYDIIVRPHPQSWKAEKNLIEGIKRKLEKYPNVVWDTVPDGAVSMGKSDLMISDTSAIRLDYALLYQRPVITLESPLPDPEAFEISDLKSSWMEVAIKEIGYTLNKENIGHVSEYVKSIFSSEKQYDMAEFRNKTIYNWGRSGEVIADYLIKRSQELSAQVKGVN